MLRNSQVLRVETVFSCIIALSKILIKLDAAKKKRALKESFANWP